MFNRELLFDGTGLNENVVESHSIYQGNYLHLLRDIVTLPNGQRAAREYLKHPGAVMVMPVFENGDILVVRQYRHPLARVFIEFPAGKIDADEMPLVTGQRELLEETGYVANEWLHVTEINNAIGYCDEVIYFYIAHQLVQQAQQCLDENEFVDVLRVPFQEVEKWMHQGWITDVKTQLGIFWLRDWLAKC